MKDFLYRNVSTDFTVDDSGWLARPKIGRTHEGARRLFCTKPGQNKKDLSDEIF
jgi:hypothetical protein